MTDEILRLGLDTTGVEAGARKADQAYADVAKGARAASDANEKLEKTLVDAGTQSARASQALDQSARANRAVADSTRQRADAEKAWARVQADTLELERQWQAEQQKRQQLERASAGERGRAQARALVEGLEQQFQADIARIKEGQARGFLSPQEAAAAGREAAAAYNQGVLQAIDQGQATGALSGPAGRGTLTEMRGSLKSADDAARGASLGFHRLNNSLIVMARQATNTHPVVGQLADVVGTFAIGTAMMVPILAGIAALGFAWQALTRDAREAREEQERLIGILEDVAERRRIAALGPGGEINTAVADRRERMREIEEEVSGIGGRPRYRPGPANRDTQRANELAEEYELLRKLVTEGEAEIADERRDAEEREAAERERAAEQQIEALERAEAERARVRRAGVELNVRLLQIEKDAEAKRAEQRREIHEERLRLLQIERDAEAQRAEERRREHELRLRVEAAARRHEQEQRQEQERAEQKLAQARERALNNLVQALNNVGRAYGGVTDQVLALASAALSLERMPMESRRDKLTAYGAAAATGIGFGASTGSPILGGAGGAASGFAMAGAGGAIIGGVAGIVSGLLEQGHRMDVARGRWEQAMEDFRAMSDPGSPLEQGMRQMNKMFLELAQQAAAASGISANVIDIDQARAYVEAARGLPDIAATEEFRAYAAALERMIEMYDANADALREQFELEQQRVREDLEVRALRAQGLDEEADALQRQREHERELLKFQEAGYDAATIARLREIQAMEDQKAAAEETAQAIRSATSALNDPSGLRLSLHRWRAEMMVDPSADTSRPPRDGVRGRPGGGVVDTGNRPVRRTTHIENVTVNVNGSGDPRRVAREVIEEVGRIASTGGGNPLDVSRR